MDRDWYEKDLKERQRRHLEGIKDMDWQPCMHDSCPACFGTGRKTDGSPCIHMLSCPCPKCSPRC